MNFGVPPIHSWRIQRNISSLCPCESITGLEIWGQFFRGLKLQTESSIYNTLNFEKTFSSGIYTTCINLFFTRKTCLSIPFYIRFCMKTVITKLFGVNLIKTLFTLHAAKKLLEFVNIQFLGLWDDEVTLELLL